MPVASDIHKIVVKIFRFMFIISEFKIRTDKHVGQLYVTELLKKGAEL